MQSLALASDLKSLVLRTLAAGLPLSPNVFASRSISITNIILYTITTLGLYDISMVDCRLASFAFVC